PSSPGWANRRSCPGSILWRSGCTAARPRWPRPCAGGSAGASGPTDRPTPARRLHARSHNFAFRLPIIGPGATSMNERARFGRRLAAGLLLLAALLLKGGTASAQKDAGKGKMTFEVYKDKGGEYRWRLKAANGKILAVPEDAYTAHADIKTAVDNVRANAGKM